MGLEAEQVQCRDLSINGPSEIETDGIPSPQPSESFSNTPPTNRVVQVDVPVDPISPHQMHANMIKFSHPTRTYSFDSDSTESTSGIESSIVLGDMQERHITRVTTAQEDGTSNIRRYMRLIRLHRHYS